jgi:hypothetical protein
MKIESKSIQVELTGIRPIMFDRYAGDNNTSLAAADKMYLDDNMGLTVPAINVLSLLGAENTKSVSKQFFGKQWRTIALGIMSYTNIDPIEIPLLDDDGQIMWGGDWTAQVSHVKHVARLMKGIPNPKDRPVVALPWYLRFTIEYMDNKYCTLDNLQQCYELGGVLGLGTFRPVYGRYVLTRFDIE